MSSSAEVRVVELKTEVSQINAGKVKARTLEKNKPRRLEGGDKAPAGRRKTTLGCVRVAPLFDRVLFTLAERLVENDDAGKIHSPQWCGKRIGRNLIYGKLGKLRENA